VNELQLEDPMQLRNFLRLSAVEIEELVGWIGPAIQKQDTTMRMAIPVRERLLVTMRFLATGTYLVLTSNIDTAFR
jgi:hypothetical protein